MTGRRHIHGLRVIRPTAKPRGSFIDDNLLSKMLAEAETLEDIVIAEGIPGFYDFDGKRVFQPRKKVHTWFERRPMGSFLSQPLTIFCSDIGEIRSFLKTCRYVSDQEQFGVKDHWAPPEVVRANAERRL